jgi:hypothetical protein
MRLFCTEEFKKELGTLKKNNSHAHVEAELVDNYCNKSFSDATKGDLLFDLVNAKFVKKRLSGRGGFRFYVLAVISDENVYLTWVHPKKGFHGMDNTSTARQKELLKTVGTIRKTGGELYEITPDASDPEKAVFTLINMPAAVIAAR